MLTVTLLSRCGKIQVTQALDTTCYSLERRSGELYLVLYCLNRVTATRGVNKIACLDLDGVSPRLWDTVSGASGGRDATLLEDSPVGVAHAHDSNRRERVGRFPPPRVGAVDFHRGRRFPRTPSDPPRRRH